MLILLSDSSVPFATVLSRPAVESVRMVCVRDDGDGERHLLVTPLRRNHPPLSLSRAVQRPSLRRALRALGKTISIRIHHSV